MLGTTGPRMLRLTARYADSWNAYFTRIGNQPSGIPELRETVDAACRAEGRDPATLDRTVAVYVDYTGQGGAPSSMNPNGSPPIQGPPEQIADVLRAFAREGISHVQVHIEPSTLAGIEQLAPVLADLDRT
jgi:alkanesulfonate monooxygenase SsuD/methylene tetrahydromethanopterin reductase-like flavin-dependent oxidoreductase (luciferase family)